MGVILNQKVMIILIAKQNAQFFKEKMRAKSLNIVGETKNTFHVKLSTNRFNKLYSEILVSGNNPYALMSW